MDLPVRMEQVEMVQQKQPQQNQTLIRRWRPTEPVLFMARQLINSKATIEN